MKSTSLFITFITLVCFLSACQRQGVLTVQDAWARPGSAGSNGAVYFVIDNRTRQDDILLSANTGIAAQTEIHQSMMGADETMSMLPQDNVPVPAGEQVTFKPGGFHVMLVNLQKDLVEGEQIDLVLRFQEAGEITLQVPVEGR